VGAIDFIRRKIPYEEFDYQTLLLALKDYAHPRDKITDLLRKRQIVRVKKGLYVFGEDYSRKPYAREVLANLIYGPSYLSLDYALHYYGLIPERIEAVTSVCSGKSRRFVTPLGVFIYRRIPPDALRTGMDRIEIGDGRAFLMAVPAKALADKIVLDRGTAFRTQKELMEYLEKDLRVDLGALKKLNPNHLEDLARCFRSRKVRLLHGLLHRLTRER
jgi:hypothetical protein